MKGYILSEKEASKIAQALSKANDAVTQAQAALAAVRGEAQPKKAAAPRKPKAQAPAAAVEAAEVAQAAPVPPQKATKTPKPLKAITTKSNGATGHAALAEDF
jgi:hypothetical protein